MRCNYRTLSILSGLTIFVVTQGAGLAVAQMSHQGHGSAAPVSAQGVVIRESKVQGSVLRYRLYSWEERNQIMKGMEGHAMPGMDTTGKATNHLEVFITGADGRVLSDGKVGFVVTAPDETEFKTLTMSMNGGYGADVALAAKGVYAIRTKAVFVDKTLSEDFTYTVK